MESLNFTIIGNRIRETRLSRHLTQEYIANYADVNVSHISNIERGVTKVSLTLLVQICNALDVTVDYILQDEYLPSSNAKDNQILHSIQPLSDAQKDLLLRIIDVL